MAVITVLCQGNALQIPTQPGDTLLSALQRAGMAQPDAPCGGNGTCGKCLVEAEGAISPPTAHELEKLRPGERRRLACLTHVLGDCTVRLTEPVGAVIACGGGSALNFPLEPCVPLTARGGLGAAVDIGTTTVVAYLYDLSSGARLGTKSGINAQRVFGADVISRISHANANLDGLAQMASAIRAQLAGWIEELCQEAGRPVSDLLDISVAGNTIMEHIFAGLSPSTIAAAPFTPLSLFGNSLPAGAVGLPAAPDARVYLAPCVAGYVGGDITAGLLASGACRAEDPVLFLDIGTNGEMGLGTKDGFLCCAAAAGPAFEGAEIVCGMSGVAGAVNRVWLEDGAVKCSVIGGGPALGVCGSGLVDTLSVLLELDAVDETGRLLPPGEAPAGALPYLEENGGDGVAFYLDRSAGIRITEGDVRKLQLAKAAVAAGIQTLLETNGLNEDGVSALYLAGGFGSYLNKESAAAIGLFPPSLLPRIHSVGNSAGAGAAAALLSASARRELAVIQEKCTYLELSSNPVFTGHFIDCMCFE